MTKITDLPRHERPREKLIERGPLGLKDKELLAILLRTADWNGWTLQKVKY